MNFKIAAIALFAGAAAFGQSPEMTVVTRAAEALRWKKTRFGPRKPW